MSESTKKVLLPEGGEMLIMAIIMFFGVVGLLALMYALAP